MSAAQPNNTQDDSRRSPSPNPLPETEANANPPDTNQPYVFKHAPPKPDGDPWEILLKPKLEADTVRCDAWKEEVQNLLIFAGLFSAVVTAFVIESYKFLQPSPNDAVVGLLFQIAKSLNNTSSFPPSVDPASITKPFSPTSSSVRINVFFFLSLILSLTTVLIGTISLQWLREHQSYPNFSPKEKAAILHMRSAALEAWYVPVIFSTLPLLLQGALVLFLAGLIDFALPLGLKLIIPVSLVIGLTLLFLGTTTVLPASQALSFFLRRSYKHVPTPCPFKSPQSQAIRLLSGIVLRSFSAIFPACYLSKAIDLHSMWTSWKDLPLHQHPFFPFVYTIWHQTTWLTFDREWLDLRDTCHQFILENNNPQLYLHRQNLFTLGLFPISDLTQILIETINENSTTKYMEAFFDATIHCFQEISASIWTDTPTDDENFLQFKVHQNYYFHQLSMSYQWDMMFPAISNYLLHSGPHKINGDKESPTALEVFNQNQILCFLQLISFHHPSPKIIQYQGELWSQIKSNTQQVPLIHNSSQESYPHSNTDLDDIVLQDICYGHSSVTQRVTIVVDLLREVFKSNAHPYISLDLPNHFICLVPGFQITKMVVWLAHQTNDYFQWAHENISDTSNQQHLQEINDQYILIFKSMASHFNYKISDSKWNSNKNTPSVLFYLASIFVWELLKRPLARNALRNKDSSFGQGLGSLLGALMQYRTWTSGRKNIAFERYFKYVFSTSTTNQYIVAFSEEWWDMLFENGRAIGLEAIEQGPAVTGGTDPNSRPSSSSPDEQMISDVITIPAGPSSPSIPLEAIETSSASNAPAPDEDIVDHNEVSHADSRPPSLTRAGSSSDDHDEDTKRQLLPDSPGAANPVAVMNEAPDSVVNPTLAQSRPPSADLHAILPPDGNNDVDRATIQIPSPSPSSSLTPPPPASEIGTGSPDVGVTVDGNGQAQIHTDTPHLAIEVGSPTGSERSRAQ